MTIEQWRARQRRQRIIRAVFAWLGLILAAACAVIILWAAIVVIVVLG